MSGTYPTVCKDALKFAARFGFITQGIFFEYLCPLQKSQQYSFWRMLRDEGLIFSAKTQSDVFYLTYKGRKACETTARSGRAIYFIEHDLHVARLLFELTSSGLVLRSWLENELSTNHWEAYSILGTDRIGKLPDLVVDMKTKEGTRRIAFEIERSRKSKERYDQMALNFLDLRNINLILFACSDEGIAQIVRRAFRGEVFVQNDKVPGTFLIESFERNKFEANVRFMDKDFSLKRLLLAALKQEDSVWQSPSEKNRKMIGNRSDGFPIIKEIEYEK